jgi:transposase
MIIIGCDFHTRFQQIAMLDPTTGELSERRLEHEKGEAEKFYATLPGPARVGIEATVNAQWFERILRRYQHELWIGDAAEIRAARVRKQKTDSRDALHLLDLLVANRFPRIWIPSPAERDVRQLLRHRHKLVRFRTSVMNQLHALAISQGLCRKQKLWSKLGRPIATARPAQPLDRGSGPSRNAGSAKSSGCGAAYERARSGASNGLGVCVDDRSGRPFPEKQASGELPGSESQ